MAISHLRAKNFKSFSEIDVALNPFNVIIGANASGKSNFLQTFRFLRDIREFGLDNAISIQGGSYYIRNLTIGRSEPLLLQFTIDASNGAIFPGVPRNPRKGRQVTRVRSAKYSLEIQFHKKGTGYRVAGEQLSLDCYLEEFDAHSPRLLGEPTSYPHFSIEIRKPKSKVTAEIFPAIDTQKLPPRPDIVPDLILDVGRGPGLMLNSPLIQILIPSVGNILNNISIYDIDPKLPKKATTLSGISQLEEDGNNLALVLRDIISTKANRQKLSLLLRDLLNFVRSVGIENLTDNSLLFRVEEKYFRPKTFLPASLVSDGTVNVLALLVALYFSNNSLSIIEEPERNIHPYLIGKIVDMIRDSSTKTQVLATTHSPEVVRNLKLEEILLISRDNNGFSVVSKPSEKDSVKTFLENEVGIEDLFTQMLLER